MTGIYKITNLVNGKIYVGQSIDINIRWYNHKKELNSNRHCNSHLQNAWNLYGADNFVFEVIEECAENDLSTRERYWINYYNFSNMKFGYNLTDGGEGRSGYNLTEDQKYKLYLSHQKTSDEIVQLSITGDYINRWRSASHASKELGIPVSGIRHCVLQTGDQYLCYGYIWVFADLYDAGYFDYNDYKEKYLAYYIKPISKYDLYGNLVDHWDSQADFSKNNSVLNRHIKQLLNFELKQYNGFIYVYDDNKDVLTDSYLKECRIKSGRYKIKQFDLDYKYIRSYTLDEITELPYRKQTILKCCSNRHAHTRNGILKAFGYIWEYD